VASLGNEYLVIQSGIASAFAVTAEGQQTYEQIQAGLDNTVSVIGDALDNQAAQAAQGSVIAAVQLPMLAVIAGGALVAATLGAAFSALDTAVVASRQSYPTFAWCDDNTCAPGEYNASSRADADMWGCPRRNCMCYGRTTNGICCGIYQTGVWDGSTPKCQENPYPSWFSSGIESTCTKVDSVTGTVQPVDLTYPRGDPRGFGSLQDWCNSMYTHNEGLIYDEHQAAAAEARAVAEQAEADYNAWASSSVDNSADVGGYY
jgi:hypothetical protein